MFSQQNIEEEVMRCTTWDRIGGLSAMAALTAGVVLSMGRPVFAAEGEQEEGRIVELSADDNSNHNLNGAIAEAEEQAPAEPAFWLGVQGEPLSSSVLRTHLQLADDVGVVIANVMKDSPAEKAGLRMHDVLLAVNGEQITDMTVLQQAVAASNGKPIELKVIRLAKEETIEVTPEPRPEHLAIESGNPLNQLQGTMPMGELQAMLQQLQQNGMPGNARLFGPGMVFNGQAMAAIPGGVQVSIARKNNEPPVVTVTKGDQTWTVNGDDKEALAKLPDDVRPFVERMLEGQQPGGAGVQLFNGNLGGILPNGLGEFDVDIEGQVGEAMRQRAEAFNKRAEAMSQQAEEMSRNMMRRMEEMEKRLQEMQERLERANSGENGNPAADPSKA
jgi:hypothetical protein